MGTARAARAHIIGASIALVLILTASCMTYVFISKVSGRMSGCQRTHHLPFSIVNVSGIERIFRHQVSPENWLLKACNHKDDRLVWDDEWEAHRSWNKSILDIHDKTWIVIREKGVYLVYIQVNFDLKLLNDSDSPVELKLLVDFKYEEGKEIFSAAHDTQVVNDNQDAKLNTFLLLYMNSTNQLSVKVVPSYLVNYEARPFSTFITIIKWADSW